MKFKHKNIGSSLEDFLEQEGILEETTAVAIKEVIAWQLAQEMKAKRMTKKRLAALMKTSRAQVDRFSTQKKATSPSRLCNAPPRWSGARCGSSWCSA